MDTPDDECSWGSGVIVLEDAFSTDFALLAQPHMEECVVVEDDMSIQSDSTTHSVASGSVIDMLPQWKPHPPVSSSMPQNDDEIFFNCEEDLFHDCVLLSKV